MEPIRVLQVVVSMDVGGIETMLMNYYRNIDRSKVQFDFMLHCKHKSFFEDEIEALGGRIYHVPSYHPNEHIAYKKALKNFFNEHTEYKVVHSHIKFYGLYVLKAAKKAGVPMRIAHSHISTSFYKFDRTLIFRLYTRTRFQSQYTHVYACSPEAAEYMAPRKPYTLMNNAIDSAAFVYSPQKRKEARTEFGIAESTLLLGHIGRFSDQKNHSFLLNVFNELLKINKDSKLMLVGTGNLLDDIKAQAKELCIEDKVIFTGIRKDTDKLLAGMDVFVFPSKYEGFPVTLVEAQASDLPCVISDTFSKTTVISNKVHIISLKDTYRSWSQSILNCKYCKARKDNSELITNAGLDIKANVKKLQNVYLEAYGYEQ